MTLTVDAPISSDDACFVYRAELHAYRHEMPIVVESIYFSRFAKVRYGDILGIYWFFIFDCYVSKAEVRGCWCDQVKLKGLLPRHGRH